MKFRSIFSAGILRGRRIIVTGAGSGIGRQIAHEAASLGAELALVGRTLQRLQEASHEIVAAYGVRATCHACDIRDEAQVKAVVAAIHSEGAPVTGLVNNAGGQFSASMAKISGNGFDAVLRTNLTGGFLISREVFIQSMEQAGGSIVNIIADMWQSMPGMAHSGAARAGMLNLTETAAVEWAYAGVRVNAVAPGFIDAKGTHRQGDDSVLTSLSPYVPLQRPGTAAEVSAAVMFLLSDASSFTTGTCIRVDGGHPNARRDWPLPPHDRSRPFKGLPPEPIGS